MTHWRMMQERDFLGAWDLVDAKTGQPKDVTVKIAKVQSENLKTAETPKGKRKVVIRFERATKAMVANSTNCKLIEAMYGPDTEGWIGQSITLYQGDVRNPNGGGVIKGIRVRPRKPSGPAEGIVGRPVDEAMRDAQNEAFGREGREPGDES